MKYCKYILILYFIICSSSVNAQQVYVTAGNASSYYHKSDKCSQIKKSDGALFSVSLNQTKSIGKKECQLCFKKNTTTPSQKSGQSLQQTQQTNVSPVSTRNVELAKTAKGKPIKLLRMLVIQLHTIQIGLFQIGSPMS